MHCPSRLDHHTWHQFSQLIFRSPHFVRIHQVVIVNTLWSAGCSVNCDKDEYDEE